MNEDKIGGGKIMIGDVFRGAFHPLRAAKDVKNLVLGGKVLGLTSAEARLVRELRKGIATAKSEYACEAFVRSWPASNSAKRVAEMLWLLANDVKF